MTFHVGSHGMTDYQRIRGRPFNQQMAAFLEQILFKPRKTSGPQQKLAVNWMDGCWLGFKTRTGEHIVSKNAAVVSCRSIRRRKKKSAGIVICCWEYLDIRGDCMTVAWMSIQPRSDGQLHANGQPWRFWPSRQRREPGTKRAADAFTSRRRWCLNLQRPWAARVAWRSDNRIRRSAGPGSLRVWRTTLCTRIGSVTI